MQIYLVGSVSVGLFPIFIEFFSSERSKVAAAARREFITQQLVSQSFCGLCTMGDHFENWSLPSLSVSFSESS